MLNIRRVNITPFKIAIPRAACSKHVLKAMETDEIQKKFDATSYGKLLIARKKKLSETDFDRFQRHLARHPAKKVRSHKSCGELILGVALSTFENKARLGYFLLHLSHTYTPISLV